MKVFVCLQRFIGQRLQNSEGKSLSNTNKRNGFIELCRIIMALCVVSHHSILFENHGHVPLIGGYIAVEFFFILTGLFLPDSAMREEKNYDSALALIAKKLRRVFPYFLGAWVISFVVSHSISNDISPFSVCVDLIRGVPQLFLLSMAGLSGGTCGFYDYVGTGWYLSALVIAILTIYPLLRIFCKSTSENQGEIFIGGIAPLIALLCYGYIGYNNNSLGVVNQRVAFAYLGCIRAVAGICLGITCHGLVQKLRRYHLSKTGDYVMSVVQVLLLLLSLAMMELYHGFNDIIQLILFSILIIISFGFETKINRICSEIPAFMGGGKISMVLFISQSLAYMYPILPYPNVWWKHYLTYYGYVILASLFNYLLVIFVTEILEILNIKGLVFKK